MSFQGQMSWILRLRPCAFYGKSICLPACFEAMDEESKGEIQVREGIRQKNYHGRGGLTTRYLPGSMGRGRGFCCRSRFRAGRGRVRFGEYAIRGFGGFARSDLLPLGHHWRCDAFLVFCREEGSWGAHLELCLWRVYIDWLLRLVALSRNK